MAWASRVGLRVMEVLFCNRLVVSAEDHQQLWNRGLLDSTRIFSGIIIIRKGDPYDWMSVLLSLPGIPFDGRLGLLLPR